MKKLLALFLTAAMLITSVAVIAYAEKVPADPHTSDSALDKRFGDIETHCTMTFWEDAEHTIPVADITAVDPDKYVYYDLTVEENYFVRWIRIGADHLDSEKLRFGTQSPSVPEVECVRAGDVNSDGKTNLTDVSVTMKYIAKYFVTFGYAIGETPALDFNGDGKVSLLDCSHLLKYIAGWDVEILGDAEKEPRLYSTLSPDYTYYGSIMDERDMFYKWVSVIESTDGLEAYISEYSERLCMDTDKSTLVSGELREVYNEEYFKNNTLVIFSYTDYIGRGDYFWLEVKDGKLQIILNDYYAGGLITGHDTLKQHKFITVDKSSGIDFSDGVDLICRGENMAKHRYVYDVSDSSYE